MNEFRSVSQIDIKRLEQGILTGKYPYGGSSLDCFDIAEASLNGLVNEVLDIIYRQGGAANYNRVLLTGGGSVLIADKLRTAFPRLPFNFVETERDLMRFGNVFGGAKLYAALVGMGAI
jgi:hypothetical protein